MGFGQADVKFGIITIAGTNSCLKPIDIIQGPIKSDLTSVATPILTFLIWAIFYFKLLFPSIRSIVLFNTCWISSCFISS